jgi:hypothetical protein
MSAPAAEHCHIRWRPIVVAALILSTVILACSYYCKLRANLRGSENYNTARALLAGDGFANAIGAPSGPSAWVAPVYPLLEATLLWLGDGSDSILIGGLVCLHVTVLLGTMVLVLILAAQTTRYVGAGVTATVFGLGLWYHFWWWFTVAQDPWLMMLSLDVVIAGACWLRPLESRLRAVVWGLCGGLCTLTNPSVGLAWGVLSLGFAVRHAIWSRTALALGCAALVLAPWTIRNYLLFGRLIPVKANLAYELYQSQCLQSDGLYESRTSPLHPTSPGSKERQEYKRLGEAAYLARKWQQFQEAVAADPADFVDRVAMRFFGTTLWYVPFYRAQAANQPGELWARRLTFPLPFLALFFLICTGVREPLQGPQWIVIGIYLCYLLPYILVSYYERYAVPLLAVKVLLVVWALDRCAASLGRAWRSRLPEARSETTRLMNRLITRRPPG